MIDERLPEDATRAFLLRRVDFRDSDQLVTFVTERGALLSAIARSARKRRTLREPGTIEGRR